MGESAWRGGELESRAKGVGRGGRGFECAERTLLWCRTAEVKLLGRAGPDGGRWRGIVVPVEARERLEEGFHRQLLILGLDYAQSVVQDLVTRCNAAQMAKAESFSNLSHSADPSARTHPCCASLLIKSCLSELRVAGAASATSLLASARPRLTSVGRSTCFPLEAAEGMGETMGVGPSSCRLSREVLCALAELRELLVLLEGAMADLSELPTDDFAREGDGEGDPGLTALRCWSILVWRVALPLADGVFAVRDGLL